MEQDDDVVRRFGAQRISIQRVKFASPAGGMSAADFSLVTLLCPAGGGGEGKYTTGVPDGAEIEVEIRVDLGESG